MEAMMSLSHSGSIQVVTKEAKLSLGVPSNMSSSFMNWSAASLGIVFSQASSIWGLAHVRIETQTSSLSSDQRSCHSRRYHPYPYSPLSTPCL
uniref:Uncharacterized protein n=1 Tax=Cannabis sativa TaxID=3483 RepID=A0A803Q738_CANSA